MFSPSILHMFKYFNIKAVLAHCLIIQKKIEELLAKGVTEPFTGSTGFTQMCFWYLSVQAVYNPYLIISNSIATCTYYFLRCLLSSRYSNLFIMVIILSTDFQYTSLHISIVMHH